jgi:hypothetical protein
VMTDEEDNVLDDDDDKAPPGFEDYVVEAKAMINDLEARAMAMVHVIEERRTPMANLSAVDETDRLVMLEEDREKMLDLVDSFVNIMMFKKVGLFLGVPETMLDETLQSRVQSLKQQSAPKSRRKTNAGQ